MKRSSSVATTLLVLVAGVGVPRLQAADLPPHRPLRVLILSDEVNPHGLSDAELTQPGDLSAALRAPEAGLRLVPGVVGLLEVPTNEVERATEALERSPGRMGYDVLVYFAHRAPNNGSDDQARQEAFVTAVEGFLERGGGVVAFHHGLYLQSGKESMMEVLGATATGAVPWNTTEGQDILNVAPDHFVPCHQVAYEGARSYEDPGRGVPSGSYAWFNNTPDERYPFLEIHPAAGTLRVLFASDYLENGSTHLLGHEHRRPGWTGTVVGYQPGEHEPTALDPVGPNFQILANALLHAAGAVPRDGHLLTVRRSPTPDRITLRWTGCRSEVDVFASPDPESVGAPATFRGRTPGNAWTEDLPAEDLVFYRVSSP